MRKLLVMACLVLMTAPAAEARHWRWHWPGGNLVGPPDAYGFAPGDLPPGDLRRGRQRRELLKPTDMIPPNWQLQTADPNWQGKRFLSPDGSSWLAVYSFPVANESIAKHMQSVAFSEGETLTYLRGQPDWIVVSGTKDDRIFYRKAAIACDGKVWHHIAFEYPSGQQQQMTPFVMRAAAILDLAENDGCDEAAASVTPER